MMDRGLTLALCVALTVPSSAMAKPAKGTEEVDPNYEEAKQLYEKGRGKFETADYVGAIEDWTEAYNMLPPTRDSGRIKVLLLYDIAGARELAYEVDNEISHLRQAKILLENFEKNVPTYYAEGDRDEEYQRVRDRIAKIDAEIAEAEGDGSGGTGATDVAPPDDTKPQGSGKGMVIAGATLLSVGVAGLGLMAGGLAMGSAANELDGIEDDDIEGRRDQFKRGRTGNGMAYAGGIAGGAMAVTGAVLLAIGLKRRSAATAWTPAVSPTFAGLAVRGRF